MTMGVELNRHIAVLDHGYVSLVESWGSDERIIEAARMSTQKGFEGWGPKCKMCGLYQGEEDLVCLPSEGKHVWVGGDEKLLAYLYENKHSTPFEFAGLVIEVQAPIFVFREWHRHRTQSYNEMSARYAPLPDLNYVPSVERLVMTAAATKQAAAASGAAALTQTNAEEFQLALRADYALVEATYQQALRDGVPKELARLVLPVGRYSRMRASANLRNWLTFLTLRLDSHAQWEIQQYANAVGGFIKELFPRTWELFELEREERRAFQEWRKEHRRG